jgi:phenylpyruvate tautomerase PptA (4-oxalocrotonate tautomerase family)
MRRKRKNTTIKLVKEEREKMNRRKMIGKVSRLVVTAIGLK